MGYPTKLLNPGEQLAVDVRPHWKYLAGPVAALIIALAGAIAALVEQVPQWAELALAGLLVVCVAWLAGRYLRWATTSFAVTSERLVLRKGILRRTGREIRLDSLTDISCSQSLSDRVLRCGDILLESPGRDSQEVFPDLPHPVAIQNEIYRLLNQRRGPAAGAGGVWQAADPSGVGRQPRRRPGAGDAGGQAARRAAAALSWLLLWPLPSQPWPTSWASLTTCAGGASSAGASSWPRRPNCWRGCRAAVLYGGEHEALARLGRLLPAPPEGEVWFGDDAAVVRPGPGAPLLLLAADTVVAGVDADLSLTSLSDFGWKAMAVNVSDIAAMGGTPGQAVVSVVGLGPADLESLYEGVLAAAGEYRCPVVGGDLSAGQQVVVSVAMTGSVDGRPVLRRGARPGDTIWVTGPLGASAAGLRVLRGRGLPGAQPPWPAEEDALVAAHARPRPALAAGGLARRSGATAMIDVSDGLLADLGQLASQSEVGFELAEVPAAAGATREEALAGGDDYVLVFTMRPAGGEPARQAFTAAGLSAPLLIGECVPDPSRHLVAGETVQLRGWEHVF